jgi:Asp-tRNA(Asn)/Glu-tRNA(Gln) amidotransferase A subunit family amidase
MPAKPKDLCFLTAAEAIEAFRSRALSPVELTKALIARSEDVQKEINALTYMFPEQALAAAAQAERAYQRNEARPLEGVCFACKDFHAVRGQITTYGSKAFRSHRPDHTAPYVQRLLDAGAIMLSRSTTPEFAYDARTSSPLWGLTRNPWNLEYSAGGSSGGAAAAVASGMVTIADGTDGGGSIRIPAAACGVVGYKPPFGRNPTDRLHPLETMLHYGPITRSVADAALMQNVTSGVHDADVTSLRDRMVLPTAPQSVAGTRIALSMDLGFFHVDPEIRENTRAAVQALRDLGCIVDEVQLGWTWDVVRTWALRWAVMLAASHGDLLERFENDLDPDVVAYIRKGQAIDAITLYRTKEVIANMYATLSPIFAHYEALICPTLALPSVRHDEDYKDFRIDGQRVPLSRGGWSMTSPFNLLNQCPVISVPTGFASTGVPTGMQIAGRTYDDAAVFRIAAAFETIKPWSGRRPLTRR